MYAPRVWSSQGERVMSCFSLLLDWLRKTFCRVAALLAVVLPFKQSALSEKQVMRNGDDCGNDVMM